ncbi:DUF2345 domain-containing protein, partial [uncultured Aquabacterium sp.]
TVQSTTDEVRVFAQDSITLTAGQSQITLQGGDITFTCPGSFTVKGATHEWGGGGATATRLTDMPEGCVSTPAAALSQAFSLAPEKHSERLLAFNPITGEAMAVRYTLISEGEIVEQGRTGGDGQSQRRVRATTEPLHALVGPKSPWAVEYHSGDEAPPMLNGLDQAMEGAAHA